jgi:hypothetical protein
LIKEDINRLNEKLQSLKTSNKKVRDLKEIEKDLKWFNKKRNYKAAKNNELMAILSELMSHPYYFELLVTPSSASMFEGFTNELIASQQNMSQDQFQAALEETDHKLFDRSLTPQQATTNDAVSQSFDNLLSKRKDLGGYAIQRTFADIFNFAGFSIAKEYNVPVGRNKSESKVLYTPLIAPQDRAKSLQNGRLLMHGDSVTGIPISKSFDELISLTVDLAGAPAYPYTGINNFNKKHVQYLLHQKTDPKAVIWFMNQPVLKDLFRKFEEKRRKVQGYTLKHAIVEQALKMKILDNPTLYKNSSKRKYEVQEFIKIPPKYDIDQQTVLEPGGRTPNAKKANQFLSRPWWDLHTQNLQESDYFSIEQLDEGIRSGQLNTELQKKVLAYFASITEEADEVMRLQFAENVDTTKYATLTSLIRNESNRRKVRESELFTKDQIDRIEKESMIAPFDYTKKAKSILKALFPKLYTNGTINSFAELVNDVWGAKNVQIERISKIVENDYIEFIYKNYGTYKGWNLSDYFQEELINMDGSQDYPFFAYQLTNIKSSYPELLDIPFVAGLYEDVYFPPDNIIEDSYDNSFSDVEMTEQERLAYPAVEGLGVYQTNGVKGIYVYRNGQWNFSGDVPTGLDNKEIHNIFFLRNPDNPTFEKNVYTNNWRNLINFDPVRLGLKEVYTEDDIKKISEFFNDLVYFSLYQSGLTNTGNGFSDLIPYEYWASFIQQAFDTYDKEKALDPTLETNMLLEFNHRLRQMNPKINWRTKTRVLDSIDEETGKNDTIPLKFFKNYYRGKDYRVTTHNLMMVKYIYLYPDEALEDNNVAIEGLTHSNNAAMPRPGSFVEYEGTKYVAIKELAPGVWQIYNPTVSGPDARTAARVSRLKVTEEAGNRADY